MFAINSAWVNAAAKPSVEVGVILSQSSRQRSVVFLPGEVPPLRTLSLRTLTRRNAVSSGLGLPPAPQDQLPVTPVVLSPVVPSPVVPSPVVLSPAPSPPQSDDEDDSWLYEC